MEKVTNQQDKIDYESMPDDTFLSSIEARDYLGISPIGFTKLVREKTVKRDGSNKSKPYKLSDLRDYQKRQLENPLYRFIELG